MPFSPRRSRKCFTLICDSLQEVKYEIDKMASGCSGCEYIESVSVTAHKEQLLLVILYY